MLRRGGERFDAILFHHAEPLPARIRAAFRPEVNEWQGTASLQLDDRALAARLTRHSAARALPQHAQSPAPGADRRYSRAACGRQYRLTHCFI